MREHKDSPDDLCQRPCGKRRADHHGDTHGFLPDPRLAPMVEHIQYLLDTAWRIGSDHPNDRGFTIDPTEEARELLETLDAL